MRAGGKCSMKASLSAHTKLLNNDMTTSKNVTSQVTQLSYTQPHSIMAAIPPQARSKSLRACLLCSIIQLPVDFRKNGCPNCEEIMQVCLLPFSFAFNFVQTHFFTDERESRPYQYMHHDIFWRCYCCYRSRVKLGCPVATNLYVHLHPPLFFRDSFPISSQICPRNVRSSRKRTHSWRRRSWTRKPRYQISSTRSDRPRLKALCHPPFSSRFLWLCISPCVSSV